MTTPLPIFELIFLAILDAINPCALAVMTMVLMAMLLHDPTKKRKVLLGGFAFSLAVFILYFVYGLVIVQFFSNLIPESGGFANYMFKGFGLLAIILGILNLKDYLNYQPGSIGTEMPMKMRPKVKALIKRMTSPKGAFVIGLFVTLFLLPCTIGPYLIFSGRLSVSIASFLNSLPWLLIYNIIFILPMIAITLMIYFGVSSVDEVGGWKDKNIKNLHLFEAIVLILLGVLMITGWLDKLSILVEQFLRSIFSMAVCGLI